MQLGWSEGQPQFCLPHFPLGQAGLQGDGGEHEPGA